MNVYRIKELRFIPNGDVSVAYFETAENFCVNSNATIQSKIFVAENKQEALEKIIKHLEHYFFRCSVILDVVDFTVSLSEAIEFNYAYSSFYSGDVYYLKDYKPRVGV